MKRKVTVIVGLLVLCAATSRAAPSGRQTVADIEVRVDGLGRLVLLIDESDARGHRDGLVDRVVLYTPTDPLSPIAELRVAGAILFLSDDRVSVRSDDGWRLDLEIRADHPEVEEFGAAGITLRNGIGLQVTTVVLDDRPRQFAAVSTDDWITVAAANDESRPCQNDCQSGGPGASSCSQRCEWIVAGSTLKQECTVKCNKGNYACCCCTGVAAASCTCRRDESARAPGGLRPSLQ